MDGSYSQDRPRITHEYSKVKTFSQADPSGFDSDEARFVFVDSGAVVVSPQDVVNMCRTHGASLRAAAGYFGTSPSTLLRFMRKNGYSFSRETTVLGAGK